MNIVTVPLQGSSSITVVNTEKFKSTLVVAYFKGIAKKEEATALSLLSRLLSSATEPHPSIRDFAAYKEHLFGSSVLVSSSNRGAINLFSISVNTVDDRYVSEKGLLEKQFALLHETMYQPLIKQNLFEAKYFEERRRSLKRTLLSLEEDKETYATLRLMDLLGKNHPAAIRTGGYVEEVDELSNQKLFQLYQEILNRPVDIFVIGRATMTDVQLLVNKYLRISNNSLTQSPIKKIRFAKNPLQQHEMKDFNQSELGLIYSIPSAIQSPNEYSAILFNALFGGTPLSKLFKVVREEHGLCYSISSFFNNTSSFISVNAGISAKQYEKTKGLVESLLNELAEGKFTDDDLKMNQNLIITTIRRQFDSAEGIAQFVFIHRLLNYPRTLEQYIEGIQAVTRKDLQAIAQKVRLRINYFLEGKGEK